MTTASGNPERLLVLAALCTLVLAVISCGGTTSLTPTLPVQSTAVNQTPANLAAFPADACFSGIIPGQTTRADVISVKGEPIFAQEDNGKETLGYPSYIEGTQDVIVIENGNVVLVGMLLNPDVFNLSRLKELLGEPDQVTYSNYMMGTRTYLYPLQGLVFVVQPEADLIFYQECVVPMSLEQYMTTWGKELPLKDPYIE